MASPLRIPRFLLRRGPLLVEAERLKLVVPCMLLIQRKLGMMKTAEPTPTLHRIPAQKTSLTPAFTT